MRYFSWWNKVQIVRYRWQFISYEIHHSSCNPWKAHLLRFNSVPHIRKKLEYCCHILSTSELNGDIFTKSVGKLGLKELTALLYFRCNKALQIPSLPCHASVTQVSGYPPSPFALRNFLTFPNKKRKAIFPYLRHLYVNWVNEVIPLSVKTNPFLLCMIHMQCRYSLNASFH